MLGSAGLQVHEELRFNGKGEYVDIEPNKAVSLSSLTNTYTVVRPGAMPPDCVMSRVCSVSSQPCDARQFTLLPSVETPVTAKVLVW